MASDTSNISSNGTTTGTDQAYEESFDAAAEAAKEGAQESAATTGDGVANTDAEVAAQTSSSSSSSGSAGGKTYQSTSTTSYYTPTTTTTSSAPQTSNNTSNNSSSTSSSDLRSQLMAQYSKVSANPDLTKGFLENQVQPAVTQLTQALQVDANAYRADDKPAQAADEKESAEKADKAKQLNDYQNLLSSIRADQMAKATANPRQPGFLSNATLAQRLKADAALAARTYTDDQLQQEKEDKQKAFQKKFGGYHAEAPGKRGSAVAESEKKKYRQQFLEESGGVAVEGDGLLTEREQAQQAAHNRKAWSQQPAEGEKKSPEEALAAGAEKTEGEEAAEQAPGAPTNEALAETGKLVEAAIASGALAGGDLLDPAVDERKLTLETVRRNAVGEDEKTDSTQDSDDNADGRSSPKRQKKMADYRLAHTLGLAIFEKGNRRGDYKKMAKGIGLADGSKLKTVSPARNGAIEGLEPAEGTAAAALADGNPDEIKKKSAAMIKDRSEQHDASTARDFWHLHSFKHWKPDPEGKRAGTQRTRQIAHVRN